MSPVSKTDEMKTQVKGMEAKLARLANIGFVQSLPKITRNSKSFPFKGMPDVIINAEHASVRIIGWDQPEVKYTLINVSNPRARSGVLVNEDVAASKGKITLSGNSPNDAMRGPLAWRNETRIEIYVPKRSNLQVTTSGEIRIEGVSGKLEIKGGDQAVNLRDIEGELSVSSMSGSVRLVGSGGSVKARSDTGMISLDGDFQSVDARSDGGVIIITLPALSNSSVVARGENISFLGLSALPESNDVSEQKFRIRNGGRPLILETNGSVLVRSDESISIR